MGRYSDIGPFTIIPKWLLESPVSDGALRLYCCLGCYANKEGEAWPQVFQLAFDMGASERTVQRYLRELEDLSALHTTKRHNTSSLYMLAYANPNGGEGSPMEGTDGVTDVTPPSLTEVTPVTPRGDSRVTTKKEPDPQNQKSLPSGRLRLSASSDSAEAYAQIALRVWAQREADGTLPIGRAQSMLFKLSRDVVPRIGEEKAYSLLMELPDFTAGCVNFAMKNAVKSRHKTDKLKSMLADLRAKEESEQY